MIADRQGEGDHRAECQQKIIDRAKLDSAKRQSAIHVPAGLLTLRSLEATNVTGLRVRPSAVSEEPRESAEPAVDDQGSGDMQMGLVGSIDGAEYMHMVMVTKICSLRLTGTTSP